MKTIPRALLTLNGFYNHYFDYKRGRMKSGYLKLLGIFGYSFADLKIGIISRGSFCLDRVSSLGIEAGESNPNFE